MAAPLASTDHMIEQVERDIKLCEEFLRRDKLVIAAEDVAPDTSAAVVGDNSAAGTRQEGVQKRLVDDDEYVVAESNVERLWAERAAAHAPAFKAWEAPDETAAQSAKRLSDNKKKEIMDRLRQEREMRKHHVQTGGNGEFKVERIEAPAPAAPGIFNEDDVLAGYSASIREESKEAAAGRDRLVAKLLAEHETNKNRPLFDSRTRVADVSEDKVRIPDVPEGVTAILSHTQAKEEPSQEAGASPQKDGRASPDSLDGREAMAHESRIAVGAAASVQERERKSAEKIARLAQQVEEIEEARNELLKRGREVEAEDRAMAAAATVPRFADADRVRLAKKTQGVVARPASAPRERPAGPSGHRPSSKNVQKVKDAVNEEFEKEHTFRPRINKPRSASAKRESRQERFERLSQPKSKMQQKREQERVQRELDEVEKYSFKPHINSKSANRHGHVPISERLHHEADNRIAVRERAKRRMEEQEIENCSFAPQIRTSNHIDLQNYRPIHERVGELQRNRNNNLQRMRMEKEMGDPNLTFKPSLNPASKELASKKNQEGRPVTDRLTAEYSHAVEKKIRKQEEWQQELAEQYTFQPKVSNRSEVILSRSDVHQKSFLERQSDYAARREQHIREAEEKKRDEDCTFAPEVGNATDILLQSRHARIGETFNEKIERLAFKDKERKEALQDTIAQQYYSQFTFKPKINSISKSLGRALTVDEHVDNARNKKIKEDASRAAEQAFVEKHTFKPLTNDGRAKQVVKERSVMSQQSSTFNIASNNPEKITEKIEEYRRLKEEKLEISRRSKEYDELKECTFQPELNTKSVKTPKGPIVVRGLGRFLQLQDLKRKKEEEKREIERKVFNEQPKGNPNQYTIPKPFNIHYDERASENRKETVRKEHYEKEMEECTFQPMTNERTNRDLIRRILYDDQDQ